MPFKIIRNDITQINVDAIVNAANNHLLAGGGVCGAIFAAAGKERLLKACKKIGYVETGEAVITKGFDLAADYVIHTAGPVWRGGGNMEEQLLYNCYQNSLKLAREKHLKSIAFPVISSGIYGYPRAEAIAVAVRSIGDFLVKNEMDVTLVVFDKEMFVISEHLYQDIKAYITNHYAKVHNYIRAQRAAKEESYGLDNTIPVPYPAEEESYVLDKTVTMLSEKEQSFSDTMVCGYEAYNKYTDKSTNDRKKDTREIVWALQNLDESFSQCLFRMIDERGMTDVETYKRANIDRKLFSKIRKDKGYKPKKTTAVAFAVALELSLAETNALLSKAGYVLSHSSKFDVIIEYFILNGNYKIMEINEALFAFDQILIGG